MSHVWKKCAARRVTLTDGIATHDSGQYFSSEPIMSHWIVFLILGWIKSFSNLNGRPEVIGSRMKTYLTWSEKEKIVTEAYGAASHIKSVARKYKVWPSQIRYWKSKLESMAADPTITVIQKRHCLALKLIHPWRSRKDPGVYPLLREYYDRLREEGHAVTALIRCREYRRLANDSATPSHVLYFRIYR